MTGVPPRPDDRVPAPRPAVAVPGARVARAAVTTSAVVTGLIVATFFVGSALERGLVFVPLTPIVLVLLLPFVTIPGLVLATAAMLHPGRPRRLGLLALALTLLPVVLGALNHAINVVVATLPTSWP